MTGALKHLRAQLRARLRLEKVGTPFAHLLLYRDGISRKSLGLPKGAAWGLVPHELAPEMETVIRQRLSVILPKAGVLADLACAITGTADQVVLPAPKAWRRAAENEGVRVRSLTSRFVWLKTQIRLLWSGMRVYLGYIKRQVAASKDSADSQPYAVFINVSKRALPERIDPDGNNWDLINWYRRSKIFDGDVKKIWFNLSGNAPKRKVCPEIELVRHPLAKLDHGAFFKFALEGAAQCLWALASLALGRWWAPVVLREALDLNYARRIPATRRARDYFFHSTIKNVRPLWTFEVERTGSRVTCIMYSHHIGLIHPGHPEMPAIDLEYSYLSWGRYAVWDTAQKQIMLDCGTRPAEFIEVGPVSVVDDVRTLPTLPENAVGIFDVNPIHPTIESAKGLVRPYFTVDNMLDFIDQSCRAIRAAGGVPILKPKGLFEHAYFQGHRFQKLIERHGCILLDCGVSVLRLSQTLDAMIVCPFTSIPSLGAMFGTPACYFDPTGTLKGFEAHAHGNALVIGEEALTHWLEDAMSKPGHMKTVASELMANGSMIDR